jgi:hypothetical protein
LSSGKCIKELVSARFELHNFCMTSKQSKLLLGGLSVAAVIVGIVLFSSMGKKRQLSYRVTGVEPEERQASTPPPSTPDAAQTPRAAAPEPQRQQRQQAPAEAPEAAAPVADAAAADGGSTTSSTTKRPATRAELKEQARGRQLQMYRAQLAALGKQREKLLDTIARLKREGASKEAMESLQTRLQQLIEAEPRIKAHLKKLEAK